MNLYRYEIIQAKTDFVSHDESVFPHASVSTLSFSGKFDDLFMRNGIGHIGLRGIRNQKGFGGKNAFFSSSVVCSTLEIASVARTASSKNIV